MKNRIVKIVMVSLLFVASFIIIGVVQDKANTYSVSATVYGKDCDGYTLFETPDGNIWAYELADEDYLQKGKEVTLNMYDNSPDGKDVRWNTILSIEIDGQRISECFWDGTETE